ncbi:MAG TPA: hypothetical protein VN580_01605, partial [Clostridia bacterium]|nr:hypothetical protein [Clostridia bacterium]
LVLSVSLLACTNASANAGNGQQQTGEADKDHKAAVIKIVEAFGKKLQGVSLLAPKDILEKSMRENYGKFVSPELLEKWISNPESAPGRLTSSPWPDRIEVLEVKQLSENKYQVRGEIIEIANAKDSSTEVAAKRPITLVLEMLDGKWLITAADLGEYEETASDGKPEQVIYKNIQYGFNFPLPDSWKGYKIITDKWEGTGKVTETGPIISIRHPEWTDKTPRQDIPIMIFTLAQWNSMQKGDFHIGAAPIDPTELGRNIGYVFALPARYNYAFPAGYEEVEEILKNNPIQTLDECGVKEPEALSLKDFFPVSVGSTWKYLGEGNEYATFERKALFREGDKAQFSEDNGGTVSASVFKVADKEIVRTFFRGEEYNQENLMNEKANDNTIILKEPLKAGTKWKNQKDDREIAATDAVVETPAGKFTGCIKVSIRTENSTMYEYYKAGVGMVKREFVSEGMTVTSILEKYE